MLYISAPSSSPININLTAINSTSVYISWDELNCTERNGNITSYSFTFNRVGDLKVINVTNVQQLLMNGLYPHRQYSFEVAAVNINGVGPSSNTSFEMGYPESEKKIDII